MIPPLLCGKGASAPGPYSYATTFSATETPLSDNGAWLTPIPGGDTQVNAAGGVTVCTQVGDNSFTDSTACLAAQPSGVFNYLITAVVFREAGFSPAGTREVEILVRVNKATGEFIEFTLAYDGAYAQLVHVGIGGAGSSTFSYIGGSSRSGPAGGIQDGDVVTVSVVGNRYLLKINGTPYIDITASADDASNPLPTKGCGGLGHWRSNPPSGTDHQNGLGFTSWSLQQL